VVWKSLSLELGMGTSRIEAYHTGVSPHAGTRVWTSCRLIPFRDESNHPAEAGERL
jgi:hypothetical protein